MSVGKALLHWYLSDGLFTLIMWSTPVSVAALIVLDLLERRANRRCLAALKAETEARIAARKGEP